MPIDRPAAIRVFVLSLSWYVLATVAMQPRQPGYYRALSQEARPIATSSRPEVPEELEVLSRGRRRAQLDAPRDGQHLQNAEPRAPQTAGSEAMLTEVYYPFWHWLRSQPHLDFVLRAFDPNRSNPDAGKVFARLAQGWFNTKTILLGYMPRSDPHQSHIEGLGQDTVSLEQAQIMLATTADQPVASDRLGSSSNPTRHEVSQVLVGHQDHNTCAICLEKFKSPKRVSENQWSFSQVVRLTHCQHYFHPECLHRWMVDWAKMSCPTCRAI